MNDIDFVLASNSPRRKELLASLIPQFDVLSADVDERLPDGILPSQAVRILARRKAQAVYERIQSERPNAVVLGSDTVVAMREEILGKPTSPQHAEEMLKMLSGRTHTVHTGVCLVGKFGETVEDDVSYVTFYPLTEEKIKAYVKGGSPMDKAGAYGIQDGVVVEKYDGSYSNIVGLPLELTEKMIKEVMRDYVENSH